MIRPISGNDTSAVVAAWNRSLPRDTTTESRFAKWLYADPDFDVETGEGAWVAEGEDGRVVGFIRAIRRVLPNDRCGVEERMGWIPVLFVVPESRRMGTGSALLDVATKYLSNGGAKHIWVCGNTGSAPGYLFPGVDVKAYAAGNSFFQKHGFVVDHEPISMSGLLLELDIATASEADMAGAHKAGPSIESLRPETMMAFLAFLRRSFPGDWNAAARAKINSGDWSQLLIAVQDGEVLGYCQWESDGHFGPFGVHEKTRGKGLGRALFAEACRRMQRDDIRHVWFNWADEGAARFYRRLGLTATRQFAILRKDL